MRSDRPQYLGSNNKLLEETLNEFSQKPFLFASLNEIVKRADFNKGSFYYRFQNKEELYVALIDLINAQHLPFYNEAVLSLKKPHRPSALAFAAFESLRRLFETDPRFPLVLERFALEDPAFQRSIRSQSVEFAFDRLRNDLKHAGFDLHQNADRLAALSQLYHGVINWPIDRRQPEDLRALLEALLGGSPAQPEGQRIDPMQSEPSVLKLEPGWTLVTGPRRTGKTALAVKTAQAAVSTGKRAMLFDVHSGKVREWTESSDRTVPIRTFVRQGWRRFRHQPTTDFGWEETLRLKASSLTERPLVFALYEAILRKPDMIVVDEPALDGNAWEYPPILAALLKFSATNSTMLVSSHVVSGVWGSADRFVFASRGHAPAMLTRSELIAKHPTRKLLIRYFEHGVERTARIDLDPRSLSTFQTDHPNAAILDLGSATADWAAVYKRETGEELL